MARRDKLFDGIRNNPKDVRFSDACKAAELLGFDARPRTGTSHCLYVRRGERVILNFQDRKGRINRYQAEQLIEMIDKYEDEL